MNMNSEWLFCYDANTEFLILDCGKLKNTGFVYSDQSDDVFVTRHLIQESLFVLGQNSSFFKRAELVPFTPNPAVYTVEEEISKTRKRGSSEIANEPQVSKKIKLADRTDIAASTPLVQEGVPHCKKRGRSGSDNGPAESNKRMRSMGHADMAVVNHPVQERSSNGAVPKEVVVEDSLASNHPAQEGSSSGAAPKEVAGMDCLASNHLVQNGSPSDAVPKEAVVVNSLAGGNEWTPEDYEVLEMLKNRNIWRKHREIVILMKFFQNLNVNERALRNKGASGLSVVHAKNETLIGFSAKATTDIDALEEFIIRDVERSYHWRRGYHCRAFDITEARRIYHEAHLLRNNSAPQVQKKKVTEDRTKSVNSNSSGKREVNVIQEDTSSSRREAVGNPSSGGFISDEKGDEDEEDAVSNLLHLNYEEEEILQSLETLDGGEDQLLDS